MQVWRITGVDNPWTPHTHILGLDSSYAAGSAMLGVGVATSADPDRAEKAALAATEAPLIQRSIERATGIVYNITGKRRRREAG